MFRWKRLRQVSVRGNMDIDKDAWIYWYPRKEEIIDEDMSKIEKIFRDNGVLRILDLGCGTGRHTIYFAERGFDVYGFDFSSYAIKRSAERLKHRKLHAHLMIWDMSTRFPYENDFFDAVIAIRVIHHAQMRVIEHVVSEVSRTTKKQGFFYAQVPILEKTSEYKRSAAKGSWTEPGTWVPLEGPEKGIPHHSFKKQELSELLSSFNFEIKEVREREGHYNLLAIKRA